MVTATEMCPLQQTVTNTATDYWNDSCSVEELKYAIARGAVGATSNPTIVHNVLKQEMPLWRNRILQLIEENPTWSEDQIAWKLFEEITVRGAEMLMPVFKREKGRKGRLSIQTNPAFYRDPEALVKQALHFSGLAPNMQVKLPVTQAGIAAVEEATYLGVNINGTVSFTVPQTMAVAEAVERGLNRRAAEGLPIDDMTPICTLMVGRLDDWMHVLAKRDQILVTPGTLDWAGIACIKKAYGIYKERGYRTRLLAAAYRHHLHWSELIGGDITLTIPHEWQVLFNAADIPVKERFFNPVPTEILDTLYEKFADFRRAYDADGLRIDEFDSYGATVRTLRTFIGSVHDLIAVVRDFMLPNPDL
ncbi:MAG TPA: transaldolase family protein [Chthonomonadaceae bacterium]|nr:transaldolase family protein [Chthonomonadaceae bacterium]